MALTPEQIALLNSKASEQINLFLLSKFENYNNEWNLESLEQFIYLYHQVVFSIQNEIVCINEDDRKQIRTIVKNLFDFAYSQN